VLHTFIPVPAIPSQVIVGTVAGTSLSTSLGVSPSPGLGLSPSHKSITVITTTILVVVDVSIDPVKLACDLVAKDCKMSVDLPWPK
jgi:hypothetical protein